MQYCIKEVKEGDKTKFYVKRGFSLFGFFIGYKVNKNFFAKPKQAERFLKRRIEIPEGKTLKDVEL